MKQTFFIYGTLMPGFRLQAEMHGARFVGAAQVPGRLVDLGRYPGLLPGEGQVTGEVYEVDEVQLARLDAVEGLLPGDPAASPYWREMVTVLCGPMQGRQVQTYVYKSPSVGCVPIPHGDYRRYVREVGRES
ncbi:gamma-glutamylcyclotransferase [Limnohabitans sp. 2KL-17]|uniref:gamma-glutamylcyclotransferase family protein n=1 Tax=Limnohabitans sp. 2KL-17 TaxID=1100704 RepID=UPI000D3D6687|nr:gamma-glutamylcyclotransferase family protein [Limnohabitans sp. 2KL-17]PUE48550.1 gamma-glutamylcyclotransferase [Limnohabitans sp. 2KL-17]